jgi:hypothetical protein
MTIAFTCPHCQATTQVDDSYAGQSGPCAQCGKTVTVPGGARPSAGGSSSSKTIVVVLAACLLGLVLCGGGLAALLIPAMSQASAAAERSTCTNNLKQIALALHNYHDTHKTFPPAYFADANGQPMTSWRVLILPYMEQAAIYDQYDFDEPWDSPANMALTSVTLPSYTCPSDPTSTCNYFVVNVPGGIFDGDKASRFADITDGTSNTILVVEATGTGIDWAEPRDLDPRALGAAVNRAPGVGIASNHPSVAMVALADGSVRALDETTANSILQLLITKNDGQVVPAY